MKNKIVIDESDKGVEYKTLLKIETEEDNYIIYTKNETNDYGDIICYVASYSYVDGIQVLDPITDDKTLDMLDNILIQVQRLVNKKGNSDTNE